MLWLKVHSHLLLRACLLSSKRKLPPQACQVRPELPSVVCHPRACSSLASCTSVVRVLCLVLEPTAFLVHPVLAAIAEDAVAAHLCDRRRMETCLNSAGGPGPYRRSWFSQSFLLHCFFPSQEPPDTFLERFSDDNKVIGIEALLLLMSPTTYIFVEK